MSAPVDDLALWKELLAPARAALVERAAEAKPDDVRAIAALRKDASPALVTLALELAAARRKAASKLAEADRIVADVEGVEQATDRVVAAHKARRFEAAGVTEVVDLCCGIGGDARELARVASVVAVDRSPLRAWMAERNAGCAVETADVESRPWPDVPFHVDPSRRDASGRRAWRLEDIRPGPEWLARLLAASPDGAIKLGPGVDPEAVPGEGELEFVTHGRSLVQAIVWSGRLARRPGERTATRLPDGVSVTGAPSPPPVGDEEWAPAHLYVPDPALERAGLVGARADAASLAELAPGLGILGGDRAVDDPFLAGFEVVERLPFHEKKVGAAVAARGFGRVEVKTRGRAVDPNALERRWRGRRGDAVGTVFVLRLGKKRVAWITSRHARGDDG